MRITDSPFSPSEAGQIRNLLATPGAALECPRCSMVLATDESSVDCGAVVVRCRLIRCPGCRRMLTVND